MCVWTVCKYLQKPEEGVRSPGPGMTGSCDLGAGTRTLVFCKVSRYSQASNSALCTIYCCNINVNKEDFLFAKTENRNQILQAYTLPILLCAMY